ncbi:Armadillo-like helical [Artemisia annua]|uniref:Armadillo-like helical n=1 Tax=Artemisia annua TaxID=35608 RepID=A0A2U1NDV6_ARTAN|nr:Armadillo-like helical [Artemisia annua]
MTYQILTSDSLTCIDTLSFSFFKIGGVLRGSRRERLLSKFVENEYEKVERQMELYMRYSNRLKEEYERLNELELDDLEKDEDEKYNRKLESELYSLQMIVVI